MRIAGAALRAQERAIVTLADPLPAHRPGARAARVPARLSAQPRGFERWLLAGLLLWLLVGPRVELPVLPSLRVEDLVFAALAVVCVLHLRVLGRPGGVSLAVAGVVATGLVSAVVASARGLVGPVNAVLYAVRPLEYWIAFPAALLLLSSAHGAWFRRMDGILAITTVLQTAFAILQYYFRLPIGFSHASYERAAGLTVGPYELGAISAALLVHWVANGRWVLASLSVIAVAASISRVSLLGAALALVLLTVFWTVRQVRRIGREGWRAAFRPYLHPRLRFAAQVLSVATAGLVLAFTLGIITPPELGSGTGPVAGPAEPAAPSDDGASETPSETPTPEPTASESDDGPELPAVPEESVTKRLAGTSVLGSWDVAGDIAAAVPPVRTAAEYQDIAYSHLNDYVNAGNAAAVGAEPSNLVRFFRWHLILDSMDDPVDVLLGKGPSWVGPSVDGSYLRFFADGGVLGVLAWLVLIVMWLRRSPLWMVCVTISLLVGALFIDILYAERPMVLYWILLALAVARRARGATAPAQAPPAAVVDGPVARERATTTVPA